MTNRREIWKNTSMKCEGCSIWTVTAAVHLYKTPVPKEGAMDPHVYKVCGKCFDRLLNRDHAEGDALSLQASYYTPEVK